MLVHSPDPWPQRPPAELDHRMVRVSATPVKPHGIISNRNISFFCLGDGVSFSQSCFVLSRHAAQCSRHGCQSARFPPGSIFLLANV